MNMIGSKTLETKRLILRSSHRHGYATEAAGAMIDYMFREVEIEKIASGAVKDNLGSCKIFERLGFTKTYEEEHDSPYTFYDGMLVFSHYDLNSKDYFNNKQKTLVR